MPGKWLGLTVKACLPPFARFMSHDFEGPPECHLGGPFFLGAQNVPERTIEERITDIEKELALVGNSIKIWLTAATFLAAMGGWYFQQKLESFDQNMVSVGSLTTAMQILTESVGLHVNDASKHQNNTSRVDDNMAQIREMGRDLRDLQISVELLKAQTSNTAGKVGAH